ncbi:MAG: hypothetical protein LBS14_00970 [Holosporaceae bacterium]|jgi:undecaprenyl-diphosphatase|nr:hypothetical protein [Holosporaceae bacterium]
MDLLVGFILKLGNSYGIVLILVFGILSHQRKHCEIAAGLMCFVIIFNTLLKELFKIPQSSHLGEGYAFPSGHMHVAMVFYGYVFRVVKDGRIRLAIAVFLGTFGWALVHCRYHDWFDVLGAIAFGLVELVIYHSVLVFFSKHGSYQETLKERHQGV